MASLSEGPFLKRVIHETGVQTIIDAPKDAKALLVQKFVRMSAYGSTALILAIDLSLLGFSEERTGLFMTLTLLGDVLISFMLTLFADGLGRKKVLCLGASLMVVSGCMFTLSENYWLLLLASVLGVVSPAGNEIGPFRAIEESILAQLTSKEKRSDMFAWSNLIGAFGIALGQLTCGGAVQLLETKAGLQRKNAYKLIFMMYACLGLIKFWLSASLTQAIEAGDSRKSESQLRPPSLSQSSSTLQNRRVIDGRDEEDIEMEEQEAFLVSEQSNTDDSGAAKPTPVPAVAVTEPSKTKSLLPRLSPESIQIVMRLCILFALDSFASGMVSSSWTSFFLSQKFALAASVLGTIFFACNMISALSNLVSASIARRIGPIKTMVFTHLPSTFFLALIPVPNHVALAATFMALRHSTSQMDVAPRQAFLAASVLSNERTATMGIVNTVKTLAAAAGPSLTGWLAQHGRFWMAFVIAGATKASYDLAILATFLNFKGREGDA